MFVYFKSIIGKIVLSTFVLVFMTSCKPKVKLTGKRENIEFCSSNETFMRKSKNVVRLGERFITPKECKELHFDGRNQYDGIASNVKISKKWFLKFDNHGTPSVPLRTNVLALKNKVFTADSSGAIYAIDIDSGKVIWKTKTSLKDISSGTYLSYNGVNSIYVTTSFCDLLTIDVYSGKIKSVKKLNAPAKGPVLVNDDKVFVLTMDNKIACYGIRNLEPLWEYTGFFEDSGIVGLAKPATSNDIVIVPSKSGDVFALNAINGALIWECSITKSKITNAENFISQIKSSPVICDDKVYIVSNVGKSVCVHLNTGQLIWNNTDLGSIKTPFVSGNGMFIIDNFNYLHAVNNVDGNIFWKKNLANVLPIKKFSGNYFGPIITSAGVNVFFDNGLCCVFSAFNGKLLRVLKLGVSIVDSPLLLKDKMFVLSNTGIYCFQ